MRLTGLICFFAAAVTAAASDVKLAWDASGTVGITNYVLYANLAPLVYATRTNVTARINVGTNLTASVENLAPGQWWFAATAMKDGLESDFSNVLQVECPRPPANMRTVVLQYSGTLTNFYDVGFFRLRLP